MSNPLLAFAEYYHSLGLHPIPIEPRGKRPLLSTWREYCDRQPTAEELREWWTTTPDANVALVLGRGMFAVDIDGPEGEAALVAAGLILPAEAPQVATGKGRHVFLTGKVPNRVGVLTKVDTRSDGGYVVAPPSVHPSGAVYTWISPMTASPPAASPTLLELLSRPQRPTPVQQSSDWLTATLAGVSEGERDVACTRIAGYLWGKGLPAEAVEVILQAWADRCTPPFPSDQVTKCVVSIVKREGGPASPPATLRAAVNDTMAQILAPPERRPVVAGTSIAGLDELLDGGFYPGDLIYLAARPSVGKTALALQAARRSALRGTGVLIASLEMTKTALTRRLLSQESHVRIKSLKTGQIETDIERKMLTDAAERLRPLPLWISTDVHSGEQLFEVLQPFEHGVLGLVVVDYLQLMGAGDRDGRQRVEYVSKMLKRAAVQFNVPLLCLSSLSRPPKDTPSWRPQLSDLRESGELEHDADVVLMLWRDLADPATELFVRKQRDGEAGGLLHLRFEGAFQTFTEASK